MVNIYVPAGTYVVMDPAALVLDIREVTPALARELGMVNAEGAAVNAGLHRHGVLHNGFRRQPTPEVDARLGLTTPRDQTNPAGAYFNHYIHGATIPTASWPLGTGSGEGRGLALALNHSRGFNVEPGGPNPLAGQPRGMWMQISFGFNSFWINERGVQAENSQTGWVHGGHGETMRGGFGNPQQIAAGLDAVSTAGVPITSTLAITTNTLGDYFWSQVASFVINDQQSTHNALDVQVNATMTALGVRVAVEQAMRMQGATDATIAGMTPISEPIIRTGRPQGGSTANQAGGSNLGGTTAILRPGLYTADISGAEVRVILDRAFVRHISVGNTSAIEGWVAGNWTAFNNAMLTAYAEVVEAGTGGAERLARLQAVPLMEGIAPATAQAILDFVVNTVIANDVTLAHSSPGLIGASSGGTGKDRLPATPVINR
jgi:hypothetical protein